MKLAGERVQCITSTHGGGLPANNMELLNWSCPEPAHEYAYDHN
jgi:hypothetical protein